MLPTDKIRIECPKCGKPFREHFRKIRGGFTMLCPACKKPIAFDDASQDDAIRKALSAARKLRQQPPSD
jgi:endogenous inhibitor of DNA gyrase (YacG/DUF329 family)